ncbi:hypothetical protein MSHO_30820 [Mycobacterium shottsii]|uniref:Uncharacterized protein n=1 Tax=Mycobacterium shottsii TaxID=133549 RepID=A0A7I7LDJ6_9MYCO|nr:hypothetical protein MSHO_30820 [Mycobacterium shottsii]
MRRQRKGAGGANRIVGRTQVNRFMAIPGADLAYWPAKISVGRIPEDGDRGDVISHLADSVWGMKPATGARAMVIRSITIAPWEYPPSTSLVLGQLAAMDST